MRIQRAKRSWSGLGVVAAVALVHGGTALGQIGACCRGDGVCIATDNPGCAAIPGEFLGDGTVCVPGICSGACCTADKGCVENNRDFCNAAPGSFQGAGSTCELNCPSHLATAFTYQGQLKEGGVPVSDTIDLECSLWTTAIGGMQVNSTQNLPGVEVVNGLFTVDLDFGSNAFAGNTRWLEIAVRRPAGGVGFTTLAPRQALAPAPHAIRAVSGVGGPMALNVTATGEVGIGTAAPAVRLEVVGNARFSGAAPHDLSLFNSSTDVLEIGVAGGVGHYSTSAVANDVVLRNVVAGRAIHLQNGIGNAALTIGGNNNVGIGTAAPLAKLDVRGDGTDGVVGQTNSGLGRGVFGLATVNFGTGVYGQSDGQAGTGVVGECTDTGAGTNIGVHGKCHGTNCQGVLGVASAGTGSIFGVRGFAIGTSAFGVFAAGNMGASGTKSFRIDHPDEPANKYLLHYAAESPEVINFYRGTVMLDGAGEAVVELPHYFAKINKTPSYVLTAVGAPMPMLHVAEEIDESALSAGATAGPGVAAPACSFRIAGGAPGAKVSWEVKAVRNDLWVQNHGVSAEVVSNGLSIQTQAMPVEVEKQGREKGTYQHPELYGLSAEMGMNYDAERERPSPAEPAPRR